MTELSLCRNIRDIAGTTSRVCRCFAAMTGAARRVARGAAEFAGAFIGRWETGDGVLATESTEGHRDDDGELTTKARSHEVTKIFNTGAAR